MKPLSPVVLCGKEILPLVEGGKGIAVSNGESSGAWAAAGGLGTVSGVNAHFYDARGKRVPFSFQEKTRAGRHKELIVASIRGGIQQIQTAYERSCGRGRIQMNVLWEMAGVEEILQSVLQKVSGLVHGITCGAGMPYRLAEIAARFGVFFSPIVSSARAFRILWKRAYHKFSDWLSAVVYEDPWKAGGHNGLSNTEDPLMPEDPYGRVLALRQIMRESGLHKTPIIMAGGVWYLRDWEHWIDNPELGPIAFQFGTRPLLTQESPIPSAWKRVLRTLKPGDVSLNRFSPTGFYSSAVQNAFLDDLYERSARQIVYAQQPVSAHDVPFSLGEGRRTVFVTQHDREQAEVWVREGFTEAIRTPDSTLIFVTAEKAEEIREDRSECVGCLKSCAFSNWSQDEGTTGKRPDPRSFCIQKTLQSIMCGGDVWRELMFAGHNVGQFSSDPFYANGFVPTVAELIARIQTGD